MLEKIEVGKEYLNQIGEARKVIFVSRKNVFFERGNGSESYVSLEYAKEHWSPVSEKKEIPTVKVRAWQIKDGQVLLCNQKDDLDSDFYKPVNVEIVNHED